MSNYMKFLEAAKEVSETWFYWLSAKDIIESFPEIPVQGTAEKDLAVALGLLCSIEATESNGEFFLDCGSEIAVYSSPWRAFNDIDGSKPYLQKYKKLAV